MYSFKMKVIELNVVWVIQSCLICSPFKSRLELQNCLSHFSIAIDQINLDHRHNLILSKHVYGNNAIFILSDLSLYPGIRSSAFRLHSLLSFPSIKESVYIFLWASLSSQGFYGEQILITTEARPRIICNLPK